MKFILIVLSSHGNVTPIEFNTLSSCENARDAIVMAWQYPTAFCVAKGEE